MICIYILFLAIMIRVDTTFGQSTLDLDKPEYGLVDFGSAFPQSLSFRFNEYYLANCHDDRLVFSKGKLGGIFFSFLLSRSLIFVLFTHTFFKSLDGTMKLWSNTEFGTRDRQLSFTFLTATTDPRIFRFDVSGCFCVNCSLLSVL
jgi:hypothetical protein